MKFRISVLILALFVLLTCGFTAMGEESLPEVPEIAEAPADTEEVLKARIENMLRHNFVYNDDFDSTDVMVDNSMLALLDKADEDGYVDRKLVEGFVFNMYGITLKDYAVCIDFPEKEGCLFIIPRGMESYSHSITNIELDGEYINVDSVLTVETHDGSVYEYACRTMLIENIDSSLGYNIVSSIYF